MPYRNKTYIAFDADSDIHYYRLMEAWKQNDNMSFNFHNAHDINTIRAWSSEDSKKAQLRERMANSKVLIVLVGEKTRFQQTYVRWEIDLAIKGNLPIIVVNLNGSRYMDESRCPLILRTELAVHVPYNRAIIQWALDTWPSAHIQYRTAGQKGPFYYEPHVYTRLGL
jgi:hypothetical protein